MQMVADWVKHLTAHYVTCSTITRAIKPLDGFKVVECALPFAVRRRRGTDLANSYYRFDRKEPTLASNFEHRTHVGVRDHYIYLIATPARAVYYKSCVDPKPPWQECRQKMTHDTLLAYPTLSGMRNQLRSQVISHPRGCFTEHR